MSGHGLPAAELAAAIVSVLGLVVTILMLPETTGKTLEELNEEAQSGTQGQAPSGETLSAKAGQ